MAKTDRLLSPLQKSDGALAGPAPPDIQNLAICASTLLILSLIGTMALSEAVIAAGRQPIETKKPEHFFTPAGIHV